MPLSYVGNAMANSSQDPPIPLVRLIRAVAVWHELQSQLKTGISVSRDGKYTEYHYESKFSPQEIANKKGQIEAELSEAFEAFQEDCLKIKASSGSSYRRGVKL